LEQLPIDLIKCPLSPDSRPEVQRARRHRPVLLHGWGPPEYAITQPEVPQPELLAELLRLSGSPALSVHLDLRGPAGEAGEALARVARGAKELRTHLSSLPLRIENVPYYPERPRPRYLSDPDFIEAALDAAGADLLLDLAHARVSADGRSEDLAAYLSSLPLGRVRELHLSGARLEQGRWLDRHMLLQPADLELARWLLQRCPGLEVITLEYMGRSSYRRADGSLSDPEPNGPEVVWEQILLLDALRRGA
jgi:uncharacterized protein (UPF0276 family)